MGHGIPDEPDAAKLQVVRDYLLRQFPACTLYDFYDHEHAAQQFTLEEGWGAVVHRVAVTVDVLQNLSGSALVDHLDAQALGRVLREHRGASVLVTSAGLSLQR
jgi:hypothetical protein